MGDITRDRRSLPDVLAEWREAERRLAEAESADSRAELEREIARLRDEYHVRSLQSVDGEPADETIPEVGTAPAVRQLHPAP